jgi:hypothetical protein
VNHRMAPRVCKENRVEKERIESKIGRRKVLNGQRRLKVSSHQHDIRWNNREKMMRKGDKTHRTELED